MCELFVCESLSFRPGFLSRGFRDSVWSTNRDVLMGFSITVMILPKKKLLIYLDLCKLFHQQRLDMEKIIRELLPEWRSRDVFTFIRFELDT